MKPILIDEAVAVAIKFCNDLGFTFDAAAISHQEALRKLRENLRQIGRRDG